MMEDAATGARRPSLTGGDPLAEVAAILAQRQPLYEQTATLAVPTDNHTPAEIVDDIVRQLPAPLTGGAP
jgi:shikimate kinase